MFSACRSAWLVCGWLCIASAAVQARDLRVCADPDNLPLSHEDGTGFENRIAELVADEMDAQLRYEWLPLRRGFVRKTLGAGSCDVFIAVPRDLSSVLTTRAYYRSSYVFVNGPGARGIETFDDARLKGLRIGVQLVGQDLAATHLERDVADGPELGAGQIGRRTPPGAPRQQRRNQIAQAVVMFAAAKLLPDLIENDGRTHLNVLCKLKLGAVKQQPRPDQQDQREGDEERP